MKRILLLLFVASLYSCQSKENKHLANESMSTTKDERPNMRISLVDGTALNTKEVNDKFALILFQPDCDHCQHEAQELQPRLSAFKNYMVYFISSAPREEVEKFSSDYKLQGSNIKFGVTETQDILDNFGPIPAPSIFIYDDTGKLIKSFKGQTDVQQIVDVL